MKKKSREEKGRIRRALALLTAVAAVVGAAGCGSGERRGGGVYLEDDDYLITVGFSQSGEDSPWKTANTESLKSTLIEDNGYELLWAALLSRAWTTSFWIRLWRRAGKPC